MELTNMLLEKGAIGDIPISKKEAAEIPAYIFNRRVKLGNTYVSQFQRDLHQVLQNPEKTAILAKLLKNNLDISPLLKIAEDKVARKVEDSVQRRKTKKTVVSRKKSIRDLFD
jgi:hypothetical protein